MFSLTDHSYEGDSPLCDQLDMLPDRRGCPLLIMVIFVPAACDISAG